MVIILVLLIKQRKADKFVTMNDWLNMDEAREVFATKLNLNFKNRFKPKSSDLNQKDRFLTFF